MANAATVALVRAFEGLLKVIPGNKVTTYRCPANVTTIGEGLTAADIPGLKDGDVLSIPEAKAIFDRVFVNKYEAHVDKVLAKIGKKVNDNQKGALSSWSFNCGGPENSAVWGAIANDDYARVPLLLSRWNKGGGKVLPGLVRRRKAEGQLWEGDVAGALKTAGAVIPGTMPQQQYSEPPKPTVPELTGVAVNNRVTKTTAPATGGFWAAALSWWDSLSTFQQVGTVVLTVAVLAIAGYGIYRIVKYEKENWA